jgi:hypothetical protein
MWKPTTIKRFVKPYSTSTRVLRVDTDAGEGFLKALGNPEGPHVLACELVGTILAHWLGLPTLEYAIIRVTEEDELPFAKGGFALPGPAFITKAVDGFSWGGDRKLLGRLIRPSDLARMVVLDTWLRNCDRYRPAPDERVNRDNVFLVRELGPGKRLSLIAIDHTHTFTCGRELTVRLGNIDTIQDPTVYGYFPEFQWLVTRAGITEAVERLAEMDDQIAGDAVSRVPAEWQVEERVRSEWAKLIRLRAKFVASNLAARLSP